MTGFEWYIAVSIIIGMIAGLVTLIMEGYDHLANGDFEGFMNPCGKALYYGALTMVLWPGAILLGAFYLVGYMIFWPLSKLVQYIEKKSLAKDTNEDHSS